MEEEEDDGRELISVIILAAWKAAIDGNLLSDKIPPSQQNDRAKTATITELKALENDYHTMRRVARRTMPILTRNIDDETSSYLSMDLEDEERDIPQEMEELLRKRDAFQNKMDRQQCLHNSQAHVIVGKVTQYLGIKIGHNKKK